MVHEATLVDTAVVYLKHAVAVDSAKAWHAPLVSYPIWYPYPYPLVSLTSNIQAVEWEYTLVKAFDEKFVHVFPTALTGCIFTKLKERYVDRDYVHVIEREKSTSFSMNGLTYCEKTKWGAGFSPNSATPSSVYRECLDDEGSWIDTESHILYYSHDEGEYSYNGIGRVFAGSNPIPRQVRCSEDVFSRFIFGIREQYIRLACNSAVVCILHEVRTVLCGRNL
jgi:hypothetical protein